MKCPRCNQEGYQEIRRVNERTYLYIVHSGPKGKKIRHYIGPTEGYHHAEIFLSLGLTAFHQVSYIDIARRSIKKYAEKCKDRSKCIAELRQLREYIEKLEKSIEKSKAQQ